MWKSCYLKEMQYDFNFLTRSGSGDMFMIPLKIEQSF